MKIFEYDTIIMKSEQTGSGAFVSFPYDLLENFGKKGVIVEFEFDGIHYRGSIVNMGTGSCIGVLKAIHLNLNKQAGDTIHVKVIEDVKPRIIEVPDDLKSKFDNNTIAKEFFDKLSYSNKKLYVTWITQARKQQTRDNRITKTINMLNNGIKNPK